MDQPPRQKNQPLTTAVLCQTRTLNRVASSASGTLRGITRRAALVDDLVVLCKSQGQTVAALARLRVLLADLGLQPKDVKYRV